MKEQKVVTLTVYKDNADKVIISFNIDAENEKRIKESISNTIISKGSIMRVDYPDGFTVLTHEFFKDGAVILNISQ